MSRRRYSYSYSPTPRRRAETPTSDWPNGWFLLGLAVVVVSAAVALRQAVHGRRRWRFLRCGVTLLEESPAPRSASRPAETPSSDESGAEQRGGHPRDLEDEIVRQEADPPGIAASAVAVIEEPCGARGTRDSTSTNATRRRA